MEMQDNYVNVYRKVLSAYIVACGGYYEPKSERDYLISSALGNILNHMKSQMTKEEIEKGQMGPT